MLLSVSNEINFAKCLKTFLPNVTPQGVCICVCSSNKYAEQKGTGGRVSQLGETDFSLTLTVQQK